MAFAQNDLAPKSWELGKYVLVLSTLGIFVKILRIDVSNLEIVGLKLGASSAALIPGFIGLALIYVFVAYVVARIETEYARSVDHESKAIAEAHLKHRSLRWVTALLLPVSGFVYWMPYVLGIFAIIYLWTDAVAVLRLVLRDAFL